MPIPPSNPNPLDSLHDSLVFIPGLKHDKRPNLNVNVVGCKAPYHKVTAPHRHRLCPFPHSVRCG
ncbi:hypothetical protein PILCRDRAFT_816627 [Piloderma croceum F 1598]|uniref:Uncharacterized protein n=1 Tax=Piloderma croceum (strain F 1598) TaxID=765440 RepID=A0A0C3G2K1_PILCF|nr:hypothetical protein PILCRDRAFT_816627 [Piloderma croceum F 1598]